MDLKSKNIEAVSVNTIRAAMECGICVALARTAYVAHEDGTMTVEASAP